MGASFYGNHMVWCSGMTPEEHQKRKDFVDELKHADAEHEHLRDIEAAKVDREARHFVESA